MSEELIARIGRDRFVGLCKCLGVDADSVEVRPLSGGLYARTVLIGAPGSEWAVRLPSTGVAGGLDAESETRLLATLAAAGLSPLPHPRAPDGLVVTRYLTRARTLTETDVRDAAVVERIVERLRALHAIPFELPEFDAGAVVRSYVDRLEADTLSREQTVWAEEGLALARELDGRDGPLALCHNDLVASNILDDGTLWLIDFEFAVLADPMLDLACLAAMNGFDERRCDVLVKLYFRDEPPPFDRKTFYRAVRFQRLMAWLWALGNGAARSEDTASGAFVARMAAMLR